MRYLCITYILRILLVVGQSLCGERSIYRPFDSTVAMITASYVTCRERSYTLRSSYLEYWPLFKTFDRDYFFSHQLPMDDIPYRSDAQQTVSGKELARHITDFIDTVKRSRRIKKEMGGFSILKSCDFNPRTSAGLIVAKSQKYPFVIKVFMETPESFTKPYSKGFTPGCLFILGGGASRYLAGFTRVKNADFMRDYFEQSPLWRDVIDLPRKWFFLPPDTEWFLVRGFNIGVAGEHEIELPSVYVIVCDAISFSRRLSSRSKHERDFALGITQEIWNRLDPHISNFVIEKGSGKILIIDTEHFPTMVGLKNRFQYESYSSWYGQLFYKGISDRFCRTKWERRKKQREEPSPMLRV